MVVVEGGGACCSRPVGGTAGGECVERISSWGSGGIDTVEGETGEGRF